MLLDVSGKAVDLFSLILGRNDRKDWFVKAAANQFDLLAAHQTAEEIEVFRMMLLDPEQERAGVMQANSNAGMFFKELGEGKIALLIAAFKDVCKIANRLVSVNQEREVKFRGHGTVFLAPIL